MSRAVGRFRAVRAGSVTGVVITSSLPCTGGFARVTVYKQLGNAGGPGATIGLSVDLTSTNPSKNAATIPQDTGVLPRFQPGEELYLVIESAGWSVSGGPANIFAALEIED